MDYLISFVVSVMTNIAAYIVRKWIDKQSHDKIKSRCTAIQRPFWCARQDSNLRPCESENCGIRENAMNHRGNLCSMHKFPR